MILGLQRPFNFLTKNPLIKKVLNADPHTVDFVGVGGTDAAARGSDLAFAQEPLRDAIQRAVVCRDDVRVRAHHKL